MYSANLVRLAALAAATMLALAGCGDASSDDPAEPQALDQLSQYVPADAPALTFVDYAAARDQLGLPADADALNFEVLRNSDPDDPTPEAQLVEAGILGMPSLTSFAQTLSVDPASAEFDGGKITAAVNTLGDGFPMTLIVTSQPFSEIADGLTKLGYRTEGQVLVKEGERFEQVADAGDGVILIGRNEAPADALAAKAGGPTNLLGLLTPADQPLQAAGSGVPDNCVTSLGGWENAQTTEGVLRFTIDGGASVDNFDLDQLNLALGINADEPTVDGDTAEIAFTTDDGGGPPRSRVRVLLTGFASGYDCG
jgi:hypothetical protein